MEQRKTKIEQTVAQDILDYIRSVYKNLKAHDSHCIFFCKIQDYITQTYLTEKDGEKKCERSV